MPLILKDSSQPQTSPPNVIKGGTQSTSTSKIETKTLSSLLDEFSSTVNHFNQYPDIPSFENLNISNKTSVNPPSCPMTPKTSRFQAFIHIFKGIVSFVVLTGNIFFKILIDNF